MANLDFMVGRIYVGDHKTLVHIKQVGYNLQTKPCRPVDHGPVCSGGYILQTKYLADHTLCRLCND